MPVKTSAFTLDSGQAKSQNRRSNSERNSSIVVAVAAVAVAAAVVAAVLVVKVGQSVVRRGRCREFCKKQNSKCEDR